MASEGGRRRYWELGRTTFPVIRRAEPNPAHHALVTLWRLGKLDCVITQNIDNLHQRAGLPADRVIELHGNATRARCLSCERPYDRERVQEWLDAGVAVPLCDPPCGGIIKPRTVMFGEAMPRREMEEAERRAPGPPISSWSWARPWSSTPPPTCRSMPSTRAPPWRSST